LHEMSLASAMLEQLQRIAREQGARRIVEVEVVCGVMQQVVPEALELAFEAVTAGTLAEGACLKITEEALQARCRACGQPYEPEIYDFACPSCGQAQAELTAGRDVVLRTVVCEAEEVPGS
jgi:hydrogenase nickel incorporation protein HypA/HybF